MIKVSYSNDELKISIAPLGSNFEPNENNTFKIQKLLTFKSSLHNWSYTDYLLNLHK